MRAPRSDIPPRDILASRGLRYALPFRSSTRPRIRVPRTFIIKLLCATDRHRSSVMLRGSGSLKTQACAGMANRTGRLETPPSQSSGYLEAPVVACSIDKYRLAPPTPIGQPCKLATVHSFVGVRPSKQPELCEAYDLIPAQSQTANRIQRPNHDSLDVQYLCNGHHDLPSPLRAHALLFCHQSRIIHIYIYIYTCIYVYVYAHIHVSLSLSIYIYILCVYIYIYIYIERERER